MKTLFLAIGIIMLTAVVSAAVDKEREGGLFSEGSFLSEAVSSITDKIGNVTSGEEKIVDNDAKGIDNNILEYDRDPLGRSKAALTNDDYRQYRKRVVREKEQKSKEEEKGSEKNAEGAKE